MRLSEFYSMMARHAAATSAEAAAESVNPSVRSFLTAFAENQRQIAEGIETIARLGDIEAPADAVALLRDLINS